MKLNIEELGRDAGFGEELWLGAETPPGYFDSLPLLEAFARLIVERCAVTAKGAAESGWDGATIATIVRNLLEAE